MSVLTSQAKTVHSNFLALFINPKKLTHLSGLDTIRGIAVLFVVIYHCWALTTQAALPFTLFHITIHVEHFISGMGLGVDIFFVLSGFLLSIPWHKAYYSNQPYPKIGYYLQRRLLRIVPPYWFMLTVILVLLTNSVIGWYGVFSPDGLKSVVASYIFAHQLFPNTSSAFGVNGAIWTLTIEMIFYLSLPLCVKLFLGKRWIYSLPISLAISVTYLYLAKHSLNFLFDWYNSTVQVYNVPASSIRSFMAHQFLSTLPEFGIGMVLANFWVYREKNKGEQWFLFLTHPATTFTATILGIILLGYAISHVYLQNKHDIYYLSVSFLSAFAAGLLILGSLHPVHMMKYFYNFIPLRFTGIIGYSVFLWHFPLIIIVRQYPIFATASPLSKYFYVTALIIPLVYLVGTILYLLVEKPFIENRVKVDHIPEAPSVIDTGDSVDTLPRIAVVHLHE